MTEMFLAIVTFIVNTSPHAMASKIGRMFATSALLMQQFNC